MMRDWHWRVIALLSLVVPATRRVEWRREWDAELRHFELELTKRSDNGRRWRLLVRSLGAVLDACTLAFSRARPRPVAQTNPPVPASVVRTPDRFLAGLPAAFLAWSTMMVVTAVLGAGMSIFLARTPRLEEALMFFPLMAAVPFGVACVAFYWPLTVGLMTLTGGRISRTHLAIFGAFGVYPAGFLLFTIGHLIWGRGSVWIPLRKMLMFPVPPPILVPHFVALVVGGAVFGMMYWRFARDDAEAGTARSGG